MFIRIFMVCWLGLWIKSTCGQSISSFSPQTAKPQARVTIQGTGFSATASSNIVFFGGLRALVDSSTATTLYVKVPLGVQTATIKVTVSGVMAESKALFVPVFDCGVAMHARSFAPKVDFSTGTTGSPQVVLADLDGDGKLDAATANTVGNVVSFFRNLSSPGSAISAATFSTKTDLSAGTGPRILEVADVDLDGKPDLVVPNGVSNTISIFRNTSTVGAISFASKVDFTAGSQAFELALGDLDGDGKPELVVANYAAGNIMVFRNASSPGTINTGSFTLSNTITTGSSYCVSIADIDGDGKRDIAVANNNGTAPYTLSLLRNTTTTPGTITMASKFDISTSIGPIGVELADLDGDGNPELIATRANGTNSLSVYRNTATSGTINSSTFAAPVNRYTGLTPQFFRVGDTNGDGKPDLVFSISAIDSFGVIQNNCTSGNISASTFGNVVNFRTGTNPTGLAVGDINGDSIADVVTANQGNNSISAFQGLLPRVRATTTFPSPIAICGRSVRIAYNATSNVFLSSNVFSAQLSDTFGSFVSAVNIGSITRIASDTISGLLPASLPQGRYRIRVISQAPVSACLDTGIWVNVYDSVIANAGSDKFLCNGDSVQLNATVSGGFYRWNTQTGLSDSTISNPYAKPAATTDFILRVNNGVYCNAQDTVKVTVVNNCCNDCIKADSSNLGLVACYPFNLDARDYSGFGFNGTLQASPPQVTGRSGDSTAAYSFNGNTQFIRLGDILDTLFTKTNAKFSVSGWARSNTWAPWAGGGIIVGKASGGTSTAYQWQIMHDNDGRVKGVVYTTTNAASAVEKRSKVIGTGQWFHFVMVFDGSQAVDSNKLQLYVNSEQGTLSRLVGAPIGNATINTNQEITIGGGHNQNSPTQINNMYNGRVDEIRFYNKALTANEAARMYILRDIPSVTGSLDKYLCQGDSVQLTASGASIYRWVAGSSISDTTIFNPYVKPSTTQDFVVQAKSLNTCSVFDTVNITVRNNCCLNCLATTSINTSKKLCLPFDSSLHDKSIGNAAGTMSGGVALTTDRYGVSNKAYDFNGTTGFISYTNSSSLSAPVNQLTFAAWVYVRVWTNLLGNNVAPLMAKSNSGSTAQYGFALGDKGITAINNGKLWAFTNQNYAFNTGQWYHMAIVANVNQLQFYLDGNLTATYPAPTGTFTLSSSNPLSIGRSDPGLTSYFNGKMDEIQLYDRALTAAEIVTLYLGKDNLKTTLRSDTTICKGQPIVLASSGAQTYAWSPGQLLSDSTIAQPVAVLSDSSTFTLRTTKDNCLKRDTLRIYVNKVIPDVTNDTTICEKDSVQLTATGGTSYVWSPASGLSSTTSNAPKASPASTRKYYVDVTRLGCTVRDSVIITIHNKFIPSLTKDTLLCPGNNFLQLQANGATTYRWSPGIFLSDSNIANPIATPPYTVRYRLTMSDGICTIKDSVLISRDTTLKPTLSSDTTICEQTNVQLVASGGTTYSWSPISGLSSATIGNPIASPLVTTKYYVNIADALCTVRDSVKVTVQKKFVHSLTKDTLLCPGNNTLQLQATGATTYRWSPGIFLTDSTIANPIVTPPYTVRYRLTMSDGICTIKDSVLISRDTTLKPALSNDTTICEQTSVQLIASGGTSYQWSPAAGLNAVTVGAVMASPTATTMYYVNIADALCTVRDSVLLTIRTKFFPVVSNDTVMCRYASGQLHASGGNSVRWRPALYLNDSTSINPVCTPQSNIKYQVVLSDGICTIFDSVLVTRDTSLVISISNDTTVCEGVNVPLQASGGLSYIWTPASSLNASNIANPVSSAKTTTKYYADISDNTCTLRDSVVVSVLNFTPVKAPADTGLCKGDTLQVKATGTGTYQWQPVTGLSNPNANITKVFPVVTTNYIIQTNTSGCISYDTVSISVQTQVPSSVLSSQDTTICQGDSVTITATSSEPTTVFQWTNGLKVPQFTVKPLTTTWYKVRTRVGSCAGSSDSTLVTVLARPVANFYVDPVDTGYMFFKAEFRNKSANATNYRLQFGDSFNVTGYTPDTTYIYKYPGYFKVYLKAWNTDSGCVAYDSLVVKVKDVLSIFVPNAFSPNGDGLNDSFAIVATGINRITGKIFDRWGEIIHSQSQEDGSFVWNGTFKGEIVPIGVYYYYIQYFNEKERKWFTLIGDIHILE